LAALLVLFFHTWGYVPGYVTASQDPSNFPLFYGKTGVNLFFVLSGFLLFLPYAEWIYGRRRRPSALAFYKRRILRVGPAYWVSLCLLVWLAPLTLATLGDFLLHVFFLLNVSWASTYTFNGVFWTMAVEVQFYALLPLIALAMHFLTRWLRPALAIAVGVLTLVAISVASVLIVADGRFNSTPIVSTFLISNVSLTYWLAVFGLGIGCSGLYTYLKGRPAVWSGLAPALRPVGLLLLVAGVALVVADSTLWPLQHSLFMDQTFGLGYAGLLLGLLLGPRWARAPLESPPMRFLGIISYSFYLWHKEIEQPARNLLLRHLHLSVFREQIALTAITFLGSLIVAYLSYQLIERRFIAARRRAHDAPAPAPEPLSDPRVVGVSLS
jgi:peptidoglycan/LPS O-acetylase OafA/YrhL